jgi:hypothetical protein
VEIEMLESLLLEQVARRNSAVARQARQLMLLGKKLVEPAEDSPRNES